MNNFKKIIVGLIVSSVAGCGGEKTRQEMPVSIKFKAVNGVEAVSCGTSLTRLGTDQVSAELKDLRFYISKLSLIDHEGKEVPVKLESNSWQLTQGAESVSLIDLEDASGNCATASNTVPMNSEIKGTVPGGLYVGLKATMGVPETMNHSMISGGAAPLDVSAMAWSWQSGRKFSKIELNPVGGIAKASPSGTTTVSTFNFHLGSTGCSAQIDEDGQTVTDSTGNTMYACSNLNEMDFSLNSFDMATQVVALDVGALFSSSKLGEDLGGPAGCMSGSTDPECAAIFDKLQVSLTGASAGKSVNSGLAQSVFKAMSK